MIENRVTDEDGPELSREGDDIDVSPLVKMEKSGKKSGKRDSPLPDEDSMGNTFLLSSLFARLWVDIFLLSTGYMMHPDKQQYSCSTCPFICKGLTDIELHRQHHKSGPGRPVRCHICPFFVADKQ